MADEDERPAPSGIPAWQSAQSEPDAPQPADAQDAAPTSGSGETEQKTEDSTEEPKAEDEKKPDEEEEDHLIVARRFLADPSVESSPLPSKIKFLRNKGLSESTIQTLLATDKEQDAPQATTPSEPSSQPPIITYPEFLQSTSDDPPLVTSTALLTALQATGLVSAAIYGTSQLYLHPLLARLNDSRADFHASVASSLSSIISKLESSVSELPPPPPPVTTSSGSAAAKRRDQDAESDADDPSEMFHRDVGTQTALLPAAASTTPGEKKSASEAQATQLSTLNARLSALRDDITSQSDDLGDVKTLIDVFRDDLDVLTYRAAYDATYLSRLSTPTYSSGQSATQNDEIDKAKNNIRKIKGVLLSTRSFPSTVR